MEFMESNPKPLAKALGVYPHFSMTSKTFLRVLGFTLELPFKTLETVAMETPACLDMS